MFAKPVLWGQCVVVSLLFFACPLYFPEKVQIKTEPAIYLPLGTPDSLQDHMDFSISDLAKSRPSLSEEGGEIALYDYQGEYGDTLAFIMRMKLADTYLGTVFDSLPPALPGVPIPDDFEIVLDFDKIGINPIKGTQKGFGLTEIQDILNKYDGLKFRSVPVYFYISGPDLIFKDENVTARVKVLDGDDHSVYLPGADLLPNVTIKPCALPVFPELEDTPMTEPLSPKPEIGFDLKDILNLENPPANLDFEYEITLGNIKVKYSDLAAAQEDFNKPLSATLVLVFPFQFSVSRDIPILSEKNDEPELKAISLLEDGEDLFGRASADDEGEGSVKDILERMQSLTVNINIENNLGLAGYVPIYKKRPNPDPDKAKENLIGKISLSGLSNVSVSKTELDYPFNIWIEIYLGKGQEFDIKRPSEDPNVLPLKLSLAITAKTRINETF